MEMITKKLIERNGQGGNNTIETGNQKEGISLDKTNLQNNNGDNCCSFSL